MHPQTLFSASGKLAMGGWALLVFAPRWRWSQRIASVVIPLTLAIVYLVLIVFYFAKSPGGFGTLAQVTQLFQNPWLLLAGWIHYLAFDLFLGAWQARRAQRLGIPHFVPNENSVRAFAAAKPPIEKPQDSNIRESGLS